MIRHIQGHNLYIKAFTAGATIEQVWGCLETRGENASVHLCDEIEGYVQTPPCLDTLGPTLTLQPMVAHKLLLEHKHSYIIYHL